MRIIVLVNNIEEVCEVKGAFGISYDKNWNFGKYLHKQGAQAVEISLYGGVSFRARWYGLRLIMRDLGSMVEYRIICMKEFRAMGVQGIRGTIIGRM